MQVKDLDQVLVIDQTSFAVPWSERSYRFELLENPVASLFVAEASELGVDTIIGYIGLWELVDEAHISTLAVKQNFRRRGVARSLISRALKFLSSRGIVSVSLEVRRSNDGARKLYAEFGFTQVGTRRGYYRDNKEDALIMTLARIPQQEELEVQGEPAGSS